MQNTRNTFFKGTLILTAAGTIVKLIGALNWVFISRILGGEGIGLYQMAFPIYLLALSLSSAGIPVAISILTAERIAIQDYYGARRVFRISLIALLFTGLAFSIIMFWGSDWLIYCGFVHDARAKYAIAALAPAIFIVTILSSFRGYFQGWQMMIPSAASQIVEQLVRVTTMLIFAQLLLAWGIEYAAAGATFGAAPGALAGLFILLYYYRQLPSISNKTVFQQNAIICRQSNRRVIWRIATMALPLSIVNIMLPVVANLDLLIVPARLEIAGYSIQQATELFGYLTGMAVPVVNLATIVTAALGTSLVPTIAEAYAQQNFKLIYHRTSSALRLANIITIPGAIGLCLLAYPISQLLYGTPQAGGPISVMGLGAIFLGIHQVTTGILQGLGKTYIPVITMIIAAGIKVILNWYLTAIPTLGIIGAAWATVGDLGIAAILNYYFVSRYIDFKINIYHTIKIVLAACIMGLSALVSYDWIMIIYLNNTLSTIAAIFLGIIVYVSITIKIGVITGNDILAIPVIGVKLFNFFSFLGLLRGNNII